MESNGVQSRERKERGVKRDRGTNLCHQRVGCTLGAEVNTRREERERERERKREKRKRDVYTGEEISGRHESHFTRSLKCRLYGIKSAETSPRGAYRGHSKERA